jgi:hypothetical protein
VAPDRPPLAENRPRLAGDRKKDGYQSRADGQQFIADDSRSKKRGYRSVAAWDESTAACNESIAACDRSRKRSHRSIAVGDEFRTACSRSIAVGSRFMAVFSRLRVSGGAPFFMESLAFRDEDPATEKGQNTLVTNTHEFIHRANITLGIPDEVADGDGSALAGEGSRHGSLSTVARHPRPDSLAA